MRLKIAYLTSLVGIILGIFGFVRSGSVIFSVSAGAVTYLRYKAANSNRKIELVLPLALAATLFVVALTLPHGK